MLTCTKSNAERPHPQPEKNTPSMKRDNRSNKLLLDPVGFLELQQSTHFQEEPRVTDPEKKKEEKRWDRATYYGQCWFGCAEPLSRPPDKAMYATSCTILRLYVLLLCMSSLRQFRNLGSTVRCVFHGRSGSLAAFCTPAALHKHSLPLTPAGSSPRNLLCRLIHQELWRSSGEIKAAIIRQDA